jgi:alkanesulfonate monooxygenase SsuD/methylene tetrahydromethanopterin reductase-like flavin-dependent oxidoreductase (luciferase family)
MNVGVAIPGMLPGISPDVLIRWAQRADAGPFSSISLGERFAYACYDTMTTLAAVAAVTERIGIVSSVVILPAHDEVLIAKQAATIDVLSGGRLRLGIGIGGREEDCRIVRRPVRARSARMATQALRMRRIWRGDPPVSGAQPVGPKPVQPDGPALLAAVHTRAAIERAATWADGVHPWSFGPDADAVQRVFDLADRAWRGAGRSAAPIRVAGFYCALGPDAERAVDRFVSEYHADPGTCGVARSLPGMGCAGERDLREALARFADIGADEVLLVPTIGDLDQLSRLELLIA